MYCYFVRWKILNILDFYVTSDIAIDPGVAKKESNKRYGFRKRQETTKQDNLVLEVTLEMHVLKSDI